MLHCFEASGVCHCSFVGCWLSHEMRKKFARFEYNTWPCHHRVLICDFGASLSCCLWEKNQLVDVAEEMEMCQW